MPSFDNILASIVTLLAALIAVFGQIYLKNHDDVKRFAWWAFQIFMYVMFIAVIGYAIYSLLSNFSSTKPATIGDVSRIGFNVLQTSFLLCLGFMNILLDVIRWQKFKLIKP